MSEAHFELRLPDGSLKLRKDGTVMVFKPSAYMVIESNDGAGIYLQRDQRPARKLQFPGGGIDIGVETPKSAAIREVEEEIGVDVKSCSFIGQFETYEPVHLFRADYWWLPYGQFKLQSHEVSEQLLVTYEEMLNPLCRWLLSKEMYPAQYKMLGWYILTKLKPEVSPVFALWSDDPWKLVDSCQR